MGVLKGKFLFNYTNIPYLEYSETINGNLFRTNYVIDIREFNEAELNSLFKTFETFDNFQLDFFEDKFFTNEDSRYNMVLYFIYDENVKYNFDFKRITHDFQYALKRFVTENEFKKLRFENLELCPKDIITCCNRNIITNGFNLICGRNGSGKTVLLNDIASKLNTQVFNLSNDLECDLIYKKLLKYFEIEECVTSSQKYLYELCKVLTICARFEQPILLDDIAWNSLDAYNQMKIIDLLFDFSMTNDVVITSCNENVKKIVKRRTYKPNIIDLK